MKKLVFVCLLFICGVSYAQQFGGNPAYIEWRQINTDAARVIYPEGLDSIAQRVVAIVNYMHKNYTNKKKQQINTDAARVIYPEGLDSIAQRVVAIVNYMHKNYSSTIGTKLRKINIVLQS